MVQRKTQVTLFLLLVILTVGSLWRTVSVEREKRRVAGAYAEAQRLVEQLSEERTHLTEELSSARETVEGQADELASRQQELAAVQERLDHMVMELASLKQEHEQLRDQQASLTSQLDSILVEKQQLEAKLSDLKQLRLAMRDVKRKIWHERWAAWLARVEALKTEDQEQLASGNRGYVMREGSSTLTSSPRLHVHVLEPQAQ